MRRAWLLAVLVPLVAACGSSDNTIAQNEVGSTQAAVAATPTGVADCGAHFPVTRRMSQYVDIVESDALPQFIANPIDAACRLALPTLIETMPKCCPRHPRIRPRPSPSASRGGPQVGLHPSWRRTLMRMIARRPGRTRGVLVRPRGLLTPLLPPPSAPPDSGFR